MFEFFKSKKIRVYALKAKDNKLTHLGGCTTIYLTRTEAVNALYKSVRSRYEVCELDIHPAAVLTENNLQTKDKEHTIKSLHSVKILRTTPADSIQGPESVYSNASFSMFDIYGICCLVLCAAAVVLGIVWTVFKLAK